MTRSTEASADRYASMSDGELEPHMKACEDIEGIAALPTAASESSTALDMDRFLREIEGRAYRIALFGLRNRDDALDAVQDAMYRLVRRYARRPSEEWRALFYRILQNRIRDLQRRHTFRTRVLGFFVGKDVGHERIADAP